MAGSRDAGESRWRRVPGAAPRFRGTAAGGSACAWGWCGSGMGSVIPFPDEDAPLFDDMVARWEVLAA
ncbi:hypothetical protein [Frankia sp. AiPs1]